MAMAKHKMRCVESENKLDKWLNDKWELKHVYPVYHNYYRRYSLFKNALTNQKPTAITIKKNGVVLKELPICPASVWGKSLPFSGGGYFRMIPLWLQKHFINDMDYVMFYFHINN